MSDPERGKAHQRVIKMKMTAKQDIRKDVPIGTRCLKADRTGYRSVRNAKRLVFDLTHLLQKRLALFREYQTGAAQQPAVLIEVGFDDVDERSDGGEHL